MNFWNKRSSGQSQNSQNIQELADNNFSQIQGSLDLGIVFEYTDDETQYWAPIIKSRDWAQVVTRLSLDRCHIGDLNIDVLVRKDWPILAMLILRSNNLTHLAIKKMSEKSWERMNFLALGHNKIGCSGAQLLSKIQMPQLETLQLNQTYIGNQGCKHITKGPWNALTQIDLRNDVAKNDIGIDGTLAIIENGWKELKYISLSFSFQLTLSDYMEAILMITNSVKNTHFNFFFVESLVQFQNKSNAK